LDKTEARYAEIARIMWDTNKWIMPQLTMASLLGKTTVINLAQP
jgi:4-amino-4-deoxy-L-arabinose transferase-like glycosyltransferase